jgi:hypothetical protein
MGRCNTLTKTLEDGVHADELKESSRFYRGIEGGVEGPLEASRGAKVEWASIWRTLNRLFITSWPRTGGSRPQERGVTHVLRRPVETATQSGHRWMLIQAPQIHCIRPLLPPCYRGWHAIFA